MDFRQVFGQRDALDAGHIKERCSQFADMLREHGVCQLCASRERAAANVFHAFGQCQRGDLLLVVQCPIRYAVCAFSYLNFTRQASFGGIQRIAEIHQAVGLLFQPRGISEGILTDMLQRSRDGDLRKVFAA